jgi:hypothetical protein
VRAGSRAAAAAAAMGATAFDFEYKRFVKYHTVLLCLLQLKSMQEAGQKRARLGARDIVVPRATCSAL